MRAFKIYSLSNFQICNTVLLTRVTMLYITHPGLMYCLIGSLCLWTLFTHLPIPPNHTCGNQQTVFCISELGKLPQSSTFEVKWGHGFSESSTDVNKIKMFVNKKKGVCGYSEGNTRDKWNSLFNKVIELNNQSVKQSLAYLLLYIWRNRIM